MNTVAQLLADAQATGLDRLDAHWLLAHHLGRSRTWLIAHDQDLVDAAAAAAYGADCSERARGVPLAYLVGTREFHGLLLRVTPDVLVPRPDTEVLVDWALALLAGPLADRPEPAVVDLGTGSGAVALAVKHACPRARVTAVDCSEAALAVARSNAQRLSLDVSVVHGNWLHGLAQGHFDLVLSNPPYIDAGDPHMAALHAEPLLALTPGPDGLSDLGRIAQQAPAHVAPGGWLLLEHGHLQAAAVANTLHRAGFESIDTRLDLERRPRCTGGRWSRR